MARAYNEYTIGDIYRLKLSFLKKDRTPDEIATMSENIAYFVHMATSMNMTSLLITPFLDVFARDTFHTQTKQDMNMVLQALLQAKTEQEQALANSPEQLSILQANIDNNVFETNTIEDMKASLAVKNNRVQELTNYAAEKYSSYMDYLRRIHSKNLEITELEDKIETADPSDNVDHALVDQFKQIIATGDWQYYGKHSRLYLKRLGIKRGTELNEVRSDSSFTGHMFVSTKDIICTYYNPSANVNKSVNFGRIAVFMGDEGRIMYSRFIFNFIKNFSAQHPHVSNNSVCWGNMSSKYEDLCTQVAPAHAEILSLFKTLLETYCPDAPYLTLQSFHNLGKRRIPNALTPEAIKMLPTALLPEEIRAEAAKAEEERKAFELIKEQSIEKARSMPSLMGQIIADNHTQLVQQYDSSSPSEHGDFIKNTDLLLGQEFCKLVEGIDVTTFLSEKASGKSDYKRAAIMLALHKHDMLVGAKVIIRRMNQPVCQIQGVDLSSSYMDYSKINIGDNKWVNMYNVVCVLKLPEQPEEELPELEAPIVLEPSMPMPQPIEVPF